MSRGRHRSWNSDQYDGPVIIERARDFVNLFRSSKPSVRIVHQEVHQQRRTADRPEVIEVQGRGSAESAPMSGDRRRDDFVPLPPRIPTHQQYSSPVVEVVSPHRRRLPEIHQTRRNSFDFPMNHSPVRVFEPDRVTERERDRRRDAERIARQEARRRREAEERRRVAEEEAERVHREAARERERRRQVEALTQRINLVAINERNNRREAEEEARRLAAHAQDAAARARQAEDALARERQLAERERIIHERQRRAQMEDLAEEEALRNHRRSVHVIQRDLPLVVDRGAEVLRRAQEEERRRRENEELLHRMERDRNRGLLRRQRSINIFEDDEDRLRYRRN